MLMFDVVNIVCGYLSFLLLGGCGSRGGSDGWVSSGGEVFQDRQNAWWLKNVKTVGYCVWSSERQPFQLAMTTRCALKLRRA